MSLLKLKSEYCKLDNHQRLYNIDLPIIGLTGGIATGKSTASTILKNKGLPLIDADALVKDVYQMSDTKELVSQIAPAAMEDGQINFKILREVFFTNPQIKIELEDHIYPYLPEAFQKRAAKLNNPNFVIYDVPLLFEKNLKRKMDATILIYAPQQTQLHRLTQRDQISLKLAKKIIANQMPIEAKKGLADFVLENNQDIKQLEKSLENLCLKIFELPKQH